MPWVTMQLGESHSFFCGFISHCVSHYVHDDTGIFDIYTYLYPQCLLVFHEQVQPYFYRFYPYNVTPQFCLLLYKPHEHYRYKMLHVA